LNKKVAVISPESDLNNSQKFLIEKDVMPANYYNMKLVINLT